MKQTIVRMVRNISDKYLVQGTDDKTVLETNSLSGLSVRSDLRAGACFMSADGTTGYCTAPPMAESFTAVGPALSYPN